MPSQSGLVANETAEKVRNCMIIIFGITLITIGLFLIFFWNAIIVFVIGKNLILSPMSKSFQQWHSPELQINFDFYIFNWTNPEDFDNPDIKPRLQELGPYRFREVPRKIGIVWHPENATVSYRKRSYFYFDEEGSNGRLDDQIVTVNTPAVIASTKTKHWGPFHSKVIDFAMNVYPDGLQINKTANQMLFEGYDDVLLNVAYAIPASMSHLSAPFKKFGYGYPRNGSSAIAGLFNVHTGADDIQKIGQIHSWNYKTSTKVLPKECSKIQGSTGEFQTPNLKENGVIEYFCNDLCRTVKMDYSGKDVVEGVQGFKYSAGERIIDNGTLYPENKCYCNGDCMPSGMMNTSSCWFGSPLYMSYPHFYLADPSYIEQVEGLSPRKDLHEMYVVIEPNTGVALELFGRMQVNILVQRIPNVRMFRNVRNMYFPLMWFEQSTRITPELSFELKLLPFLYPMGYVFAVLCLMIGLIVVRHPLIRFLDGRLRQHRKIQHFERAGTTMATGLAGVAIDSQLMEENQKNYMERL